MIKLLCLVASMDTGGAETFLMKLFRTIDKKKLCMDFCVCSQNRGFYDDEIEKNEGIIYRITPKTSDFYLFCKELAWVLKENRYDCVMRIGASSFTAIDLWIARFCGVKCCILRSSNAGTLQGKKHDFFHKILRRALTSVADIKLAPSILAGQYTFGPKVANKKLILIKNGLDVKKYTYDPDKRERLRNEFGINDQMILGHIGRFNAQKNHKYLLEIFKEYRKYNSNSKLLLVGTGELKEEIVSIAKQYGIYDQIIFTGVRSDVSDLLMAMDVLVFPSLYEGMPNAVIEAQTTGLPCIISDTITLESKITDLVIIKSINISANEWEREIFFWDTSKIERKKYADIVKDQGYDINDVAYKFYEILSEKVLK